MDFKTEINELESTIFNDNYIIGIGNIPILFTAPHTMMQVRDDGSIKYEESYTKAIALYLNKYMNTSYMIKIKDTGEDSNKDNRDEFKKELIRLVKDKNIKLIIDLHGASITRDFDVELGTMNNLSADYSTINELKEAFIENGINNISINDPFKGGSITQYLYGIEDVDVIQLEINKKYRDENNIDYLYKLIESLMSFINLYKKK